MTTIKVFKTRLDGPMTDAELRHKYDYLKTTAPKHRRVLDNILNIELSHVDHVNKSNMLSIQIKNLLEWCSPVFDGDPSTSTRSPRDTIVVADRETLGTDRSMRSYTVPAGVQFKVIGMQLRYRRGGHKFVDPWYSSNVQLYPVHEMDRSGNWSELAADGTYTGARTMPYPSVSTPVIMFHTHPAVEYWNSVADEINVVIAWHRANYALASLAVWSGLASVPDAVVRTTPVLAPGADKSAFARTITAITGIKIHPYNHTCTTSVMEYLDILDIYQLYVIAGMNLPFVVAGLERLRARYLNQTRLARQTHTINSILFRNAVYEHLAHDLYGKRYMQLTKPEKQVVLVRHDKMHWLHYDARDPAELLLREMRVCIDTYSSDLVGVREIRTRLEQMFVIKPTNPKDLHQFPVRDKHVRAGRSRVQEAIAPVAIAPAAVAPLRPQLCPHYLDTIDEIIRGTSGQDRQEIIVQRWADRVPVQYKYYCAACGELLYVDNLEGFNVFGKQQMITLGLDNRDPLYYMVAVEVNAVLGLVKFSKGRNLRALQEAFTEYLVPEMQIVQTTLQRSKTRSLTETAVVLEISIALYALAILARMTMDNPRLVQWSDAVLAGHKIHNPKLLGTYHTQLTICYGLIISLKSDKFSRIKNYSNAMIKSMLPAAFACADRASLSPGEETTETLPEQLALYLNSSALHEYLRTSYPLVVKPGANLSVDANMQVYGLTSEKPAIVDAFFRQNWYKHISESPQTGYYATCYNEYVTYLKKELYEEYVIPFSAALNNHREHWRARINAFEHELDTSHAFSRLQPRAAFTIAGVADVARRVYDSEIQCPDGRKHDFNLRRCTFVYRTRKGLRRYTLADLTGKVSQKDRENYTLVDQLCGHCSYSIHARPHDMPELERVLAVANFYRYYEMRCPANKWSHEYTLQKDGFVGETPCRDCAFQQSFSQTLPMGYYKKWHTAGTAGRAGQPIRTGRTDRKRTPHARTRMPVWKINLTSISRMPGYTTLSYNFWNNVGMSERVSFDRILSGAINPQSTLTESAASSRTLKLSSYLDFIQRSYYTVKNNQRAYVPSSLRDALENDLLQPDLNVRMPDILLDYASTVAHYGSTQTALETANYALYTLCDTLCMIRDLPDLKKLPVRLFKYMVDHIAHSERLVSELAVVKRKTSEYVPRDNDDDTTAAYIAADEQEEIEERELTDPFSLEETDIVDSNRGDDDVDEPAPVDEP